MKQEKFLRRVNSSSTGVLPILCVCVRVCVRVPHDYILKFAVYNDDVDTKMCSLFTKYLEFF